MEFTFNQALLPLRYVPQASRDAQPEPEPEP
jgi:hypothetical protein